MKNVKYRFVVYDIFPNGWLISDMTMFVLRSIFFLLLHHLDLSTSVVTNQKIAVPAYFYPANQGAEYWNSITTSAKVALAVLNPASGPGTVKDPAYAKVITDGTKTNRKIVGYVDTGYFGVAGCDNGCKTRNGSKDPKDWTNQVCVVTYCHLKACDN
ncbi:MAG: hypothetical protein GAK29_04659 [Acinetobacter bereziniae]|uniref:Uncharacterized protein n=1 Tax=Acinetobacter bereziniae TaxID=106648 RepID=A0A833TTX4_ACIBZ|nr:MAG: hypothetical protein GAK29_04659 [Acinetobacter bereziniae]